MNYSWIKRLICLYIACECTLSAQDYTSGQSEDEVLFVRRIMEFWKDHETDLVRSQIREFIQRYPNSSFNDNLLVILGDIYWKNRQFQEALNAYYDIHHPTIQEKVFPNQIDSLYHLGQYASLVDLIQPRLKEMTEENLTENADDALIVFYYAEGMRFLANHNTDEQKALQQYSEARTQYEKLLNTEYSDNAKLALGEILVRLGDSKGAVRFYKDLSISHPDKKDEMLLQAARIQATYSPDEALDAFLEIQKSRSHKSSEAALSRLLLMFDQGYYQQIVSEKPVFKRVIPASQEKVLDFFVGRSYFALKQYKEAMDTLISLLPPEGIEPTGATENEKILLLTLIASAHYMNDLPLVKEWSGEFEEIFPHEPEFAKVLYIEALTCKNCDHYQEAQVHFDRLLNEFPDFEKIDTVEFDRNVMFFKQGRWDDSRKGFIEFVQKYPNSSDITIALQYIPNSTLQLLDEAEKLHIPSDQLREQLIADMQLVLNAPGGVTQVQKAKYWLKMGRTFYDLKRYQNAMNTLAAFIKEFPKDQNIYQAHLLMALSCQQVCQDPKDFITHAEKALNYNTEFPDRDRLQQNLFNAYLKLAKSAEENNAPKKQADYIAKAADHLYDVFQKNSQVVKSENQLWLANYFYNQTKEGLNEYIPEMTEDPNKMELARKALRIYQTALHIPTDLTHVDQLPQLTQQSLQLEPELFKVANLYAWINEVTQQALVLDELYHQQQENPDWRWALRNRTLFGLSLAKQKLGFERDALEGYSLLLAQSKGIDPFVLNGAKLQYARLTFNELPNSERNLDNPKVVQVLNLLKELQIRKALQQEPIHLEAAIDYAAIRSSLAPPEKQLEQMRFLLARAKQDFTSKEDVSSKDYHLGRELHPNQGLVYEAYLMLIDADLARLDSKLAELKGSTHEKEMKRDAAKSIYRNLLQGKLAVSKYLIEQAKSGLDSLKSS